MQWLREEHYAVPNSFLVPCLFPPIDPFLLSMCSCSPNWVSPFIRIFGSWPFNFMPRFMAWILLLGWVLVVIAFLETGIHLYSGDCLLGSVCSRPYWIRSTTSGSRSSPCLRIAGRMYLEERQKVRLGSWSTFWLWKDLDSGSALGEKGLGFGAQVERWAFDRMIESRAWIDLFLCKLRLNVVCWKWTEEGWWKIMKI